MDCFLEAVAGMWVSSLRRTGALKDDDAELVVPESKDSLRHAMLQVNERIEADESAIETIVRELRSKQRSLSKDGKMQHMRKIRDRRKRITELRQRHCMMERQLELIDNNELNQTVIATLDQSNRAMKKMGIKTNIEQTDRVMSELEGSINDVYDINSTLANSVSVLESVAGDDELEQELALILGEDDDEALSIARDPKPNALVSVRRPEEMNTMAFPEAPVESGTAGGETVAGDRPQKVGVTVDGEEVPA